MNRFRSVLSMAMLITLLATLTVPLSTLAQDAQQPAQVVQTTDNKDAAAAPAAEATETKADEAKQEAESTEAAAEEKNIFARSFWALMPPVLAIALALLTKEVYSSLFIGIVFGACLAGQFNMRKALDLFMNEGIIAAIKEGAGIFMFLVILGVMVALINKTGATKAFGNWAKTHIKSRAGAAIATFILGILIFIDDYFNCLTVGSVMLPITDSHKISRAKLAFLIDATAAPVCMIAPISSWAAAVSEYAEGTGYSGLSLFIKAIPYNFYSLLTFIFIIGITLINVDFGPMAKHEKNAQENGDIFSGGKDMGNNEPPMENAKGKVIDLIIPIIFLIIFCVAALLYIGGILDEGVDFFQAFGDTDATIGLPLGGLLALLLTVLYLSARKVIPFKKAMDCVPQGFNAMVPAIIILTFAMTLKNMTGLLEAKYFIADLMNGAAANLANFLPCVIFLVACVLAFATGTSWGTFGILIPIVVHIFPATSPLLYIGMSACLAGAVCGDHCSPISDTTIMSSAGARCEHIIHVSTQLPYAITVAVVSFIGFVLAGLIQNWFIVFPATVVIMLALLFFLKSRNKK